MDGLQLKNSKAGQSGKLSPAFCFGGGTAGGLKKPRRQPENRRRRATYLSVV